MSAPAQLASRSRSAISPGPFGCHPVLEVANQAGVSRPAVWRWQQRFGEEGVDGLLRDKTRPPGKVSDVGDARRLGICVASLSTNYRLSERRAIVLDDERLREGWHAAEAHADGHLRWTSGRARLPSAPWEGLCVDAFLRLDLACACLPAGRAPKPDERELRAVL